MADKRKTVPGRLFHVVLISSAAILLLLNLTGLFKKIYFFDTALIVTLIWGIPIYWKAIEGFFHKKIEAEVLVAIAAIASIAGIGHYLAAGEVILIMLLGETLETYAVNKTMINIEEIIALSPKRARVRRGSREEEIPIGDIREGDLIIVKPGERIPVDGIVAFGSASVNQAPITGGPLPVARYRGEEDYAGSVVELGVLEIKATKVGKDTTLAKVVELTKMAQERKGHTQRIADRVSRYFVIIVLSIFVAVLILTRNPLRASTVLIIACPCALVLATPTAVVAAIGNAAKRGILIKGGEYIEALEKVDALVFDKTGTVTIGEPHVTDILGFNADQREVLALAGLAERFSEHALAKAIIKKTKELNIEINDEPDKFTAIPGLGVTVIQKNREIVVGNKKLIEIKGIKMTPDVEKQWDVLESQGKTVVAVTCNSKILGLIGITDVLRPSAEDAFHRLRSLGFRKMVMLTGDNLRAAKRIAAQLGIADLKAELLPEDKISAIDELKRMGFKILMVGDGINDAPALAMSDVGAAMGAAGTDVAIEASDVVFMSNDLANIEKVIKLSRKTLKIIRQNIVYFALIFNGVGIAMGALGFLTPLIAAVLHQFSSLFVVLNSLRLLRYD
ncbi:cation-translocating P-type ATPase [Candidatus Bathyarchaeota archaeon]|nr:cation-translocating P-type ATPase [Candidatus Bathyarchaeota archaeon]